jgi:hypothetical protein
VTTPLPPAPHRQDQVDGSIAPVDRTAADALQLTLKNRISDVFRAAGLAEIAGTHNGAVDDVAGLTKARSLLLLLLATSKETL